MIVTGRGVPPDTSLVFCCRVDDGNRGSPVCSEPSLWLWLLWRPAWVMLLCCCNKINNIIIIIIIINIVVVVVIIIKLIIITTNYLLLWQ